MFLRHLALSVTFGCACTLMAEIRTDGFFTPVIGIVGTSPNPSHPGELVTVRAFATFGIPLNFYDNGTAFAGALPDAEGFYTFTHAFSTLGEHGISARWDGNEFLSPAESVVYVHTVAATSVTTITTLTTASGLTPAVLLTATIAPDPGGGSVSFYAARDFLGTAAVSGGQATLLTSLPSSRLTAYFSGFGAHSSSFAPFITHAATGIDDVPTLDPRGLAALCALVGIAAVFALRR